jgi:hypothetical protein
MQDEWLCLGCRGKIRSDLRPESAAIVERRMACATFTAASPRGGAVGCSVARHEDQKSIALPSFIRGGFPRINFNKS